LFLILFSNSIVQNNRLLKEGNETVTNCNRLKLEAEEGLLAEGNETVTNCRQLKMEANGICPKKSPSETFGNLK
jgi:hypothetical protein